MKTLLEAKTVILVELGELQPLWLLTKKEGESTFTTCE